MTRFFELIPGGLAWLTLILMVALSRFAPVWVAIFIILFDIYWLLKTVYLSFHLRHTYVTMRANLKKDWLELLKKDFPNEWEDIRHLIVFPTYHEPYEVVGESFRKLVEGNYPTDKMIVVLATEEKGQDVAAEVAKKISEEFGNKFAKFMVTIHPFGLPGEIPGKGSNDSWAAEHAYKEVLEPLIKEGDLKEKDVLVSAFDVDTQIYPDYFGRVTHAYLKENDRERAIYQPIPLYNNNVYESPALARVIAYSNTFWQMMQQARPERLTAFSSQTIPLKALRDVGYWHKDMVSEDSRIFWQGYMHYDGNFRVIPLYYPVSMDVNVAHTFWQTMKNLYKQQRRWGWGAENVPYILEGFRINPRIPKGKKWFWGVNSIEGYHSWATNTLIIFALGWLPVMIGGEAFRDSILSYNLPRVTSFIINISMIGIASSAILGVLLLPPKPEWFRKRHYLLYVFQWIVIPFTLIIFGALPALEAQTRLMIGGKYRLGFWVTPKGRKAEKSTS